MPEPIKKQDVENFEVAGQSITPIRSPQLPVAELRRAMDAFQKTLLSVPKEFHVKLETMHHFLPGIYVRTVLMKKGEMIVGKIHRHPHIVIVSAGKASVASEELGTVEIKAPCIFASEAGVKRALCIEENMVWSTIHTNLNDERDVAKLEAELVCDEYSDLGG